MEVQLVCENRKFTFSGEPDDKYFEVWRNLGFYGGERDVVPYRLSANGVPADHAAIDTRVADADCVSADLAISGTHIGHAARCDAFTAANKFGTLDFDAIHGSTA